MLSRSVKFNHLLYLEDVTRNTLLVPLGCEMTVDSAGEEPGPSKTTAKPEPGHNFMLQTEQTLSSLAEIHHKDLGN